MTHDSDTLVEIENLVVRFGDVGPNRVNGISLKIKRGECVALVGESGSGKSVTARTITGQPGWRAKVSADTLRFAGQNILALNETAWSHIRGARIGFVMQDALGSLDPLRTVGKEVGETLRLHTTLTRKDREAKVIELLRSVGVPEPELRAQQYPSQLSGGQRQRALIASAIACDPELLIADEPTTALDAAVQGQVVRLLESLRRPDRAMLIVSHDLAVVAQLADRIAVMYQGSIIEEGAAQRILEAPQHPYTRGLLHAARALHASSNVIPLAPVQPPKSAREAVPVVIRASHLAKTFPGPDQHRRAAVRDVSFTLAAGETLGIVGESGCGKTTVARMIVGLETPDSGTVELKGRPWSGLKESERRAARKRIQVVFQDPLASFDPRYTVGRVLDEAIEVAGTRDRNERLDRAEELIRLVQLDPSLLARRPIELSGGQRQRIAIARALAPEPDVLICDEPVSALDVYVQAQVLDLLSDLKTRLNLSCLFISHDLGVIQRISDRVLVMHGGLVVEEGPVRDVFAAPRHEYTRKLIDAILPVSSGRNSHRKLAHA